MVLIADVKKGSMLQVALSIALGAALIVSVLLIVYFSSIPPRHENYTEFYVLGEDRMATGYPDTMYVGEPAFMTLGVGNHESANETYKAEIWLLNITNRSDESQLTIKKMTLVSRFNISIADNSTWQGPLSIVVPEQGYNQIRFLLFRNDSPPDVVPVKTRIDTSYRDLFLNVDVRGRRPVSQAS